MLMRVAPVLFVLLWSTGFIGSRLGASDAEPFTFLSLRFMIVLAILAPIFAKLLELAVSRQREYLADSSAAELTRYPEGLARALEKISADPDPLEAANRATQHMYIVNPLRGAERMAAMFSTHPPIRERIGRLRALMGNYSQSELPKQDAPR